MDTAKGGSLHLVVGCMFSGKTSTLIRQFDQWRRQEVRCLVLKPSTSTLVTGDYIVSHGDGKKLKATVVDDLSKLQVGEIDTLIVDDAQFFDPEELEQSARAWLHTHNLKVIIAALDSDYLGRPWPATQRLYAMATEVTKLLAVCGKCRNARATRTQRTKEVDTFLLIGGALEYSPRCNACFRWPKEGEAAPKDDKAFGF